jgi:hypothetical protein
MKDKKNIISEINRIHQLLGVKKQLSEQVVASIGSSIFRKLADEIVQYATRKSLDGNSEALVSELTRGTKQIVERGRLKNIPLNDDDYIDIFARLREFSDQGIRKIIGAMDNQIISIIEKESIPKLLDNPDVVKKIQEAIQAGYNQDEVVDLIAPIINNRYGVYAGEVIDGFISGVRKVYDDLTGKVDDVVNDDEIQKSFDDIGNDTGNVVDDVVVEIPNNPNSAVDEAVNEADQVGRQQTQELVDQNVARELADLDPSFYRQIIDSFYSLMERILVGYGSDGRTVRERVFNNLTRLEQLSQVQATDETARQAKELEKLIKADMDMLRNMNKDYVDLVKKRIEVGSSTSNQNTADRRRWAEIGRKLESVRTTYGDWGVLAVSSPNTTKFLATKAGLKSALWLERFLVRAVYKITNFDQMITYWIKLAKGVDAAKVEPPNVSLFESLIFPGSPRGLPRPLKSFEGKTLPNAYQEILESSKRFPKYTAYYSLIAEKLVLIAKLEALYAVVAAYLKYRRFADTDKKFIMENYGECVFAISEEMKKGNMSLETGLKEGAQIPPCLQKLIDTNLDPKIIGQMLIRADFFSMGDGSTTYFGFLNREQLDMSIKEFLTKMLTGQLAVLVYNIWDDELLDLFKSKIIFM